MSDLDVAQTTDDVGPSEVVESPNLEESPDTDTDLEDIEISVDELEADEETEDTDDAEEDEAATESTDESDGESNDGDESEQVENTQADSKPTEDTQEQELTVEERKRLNEEAARRRIAEKQLREERESRERERLESYLVEAEGDDEEVARREQEVGMYLLNKDRASLNQQKVEVGLDRAVANIDLFSTGDEVVKEELAKALDDFERQYVTRGRNGEMTEVRGDVYQFLQEKAESIRKLTGIGVKQQIKSKVKARARTESVPSRAPKEPKKDQDLQDFDSSWDS